MSWTSPFYKYTENTRTHFGYAFEWTLDHLSLEECRPLRYSFDTLGDEAFKRLDKLAAEQKRQDRERSELRERSRSPRPDDEIAPDDISAPLPPVLPAVEPFEKRSRLGTTPACPLLPKQDLYALLRDNAATDPVLQRLWEQVNHVPAWVDWEQIARGQDVFYRYGSANLTGLAYQSLLGGMGAAKVVEVLARTGGFSRKVARGRLFETTQHILQCTRSIESIQPGGEGFASTIRVRFLHAAVRRRILQLARTRPEYYSTEANGVPVNDLDCAATISVFSASIIWSALPRQGVFMRQHEITDYLAMWRYIAWLIGSPTEYFETPAKAKAFMESQYYHEVHPSATSKLLAANVIKCLEDQAPAHASKEFLTASARWLNGHELSDALGLGRPSFYYTLLFIGQCIFFASLIYLNRLVPAWDRANIALSKKLFWQIVVESKFGLKGEHAAFEFKHVPQYDTHHQCGRRASWIGGETEVRGLKTIVATMLMMALMLYIGWRGATWVAGTVL